MYMVHYKLFSEVWQVCLCSDLSDFYYTFEGQYSEHYIEEV